MRPALTSVYILLLDCILLHAHLLLLCCTMAPHRYRTIPYNRFVAPNVNVNVSVNVNVTAVQVMYVVIFLLYNRGRLGSQPSRTIGGMPTVWRAAGFMVLRWIPMGCISGLRDRV